MHCSCSLLSCVSIYCPLANYWRAGHVIFMQLQMHRHQFQYQESMRDEVQRVPTKESKGRVKVQLCLYSHFLQHPTCPMHAVTVNIYKYSYMTLIGVHELHGQLWLLGKGKKYMYIHVHVYRSGGCLQPVILWSLVEHAYLWMLTLVVTQILCNPRNHITPFTLDFTKCHMHKDIMYM